MFITLAKQTICFPDMDSNAGGGIFWLLVLAGFILTLDAQSSYGCPSHDSIDTCMRHNMPEIHIGGKLVDQTKHSLFMEPLKLNRDELKDLCEKRTYYINFLMCVSQMKRNCLIDDEIHKLYIERPQVDRVITYICTNYTYYWNFRCAYGKTYKLSECERQYIRERTRLQGDNSFIMTTRRTTSDENISQKIHEACLKLRAKEHCYYQIINDCGYKSRIYAKDLLELLRPAICSASHLSCPITVIVTLLLFSRFFSIG